MSSLLMPSQTVITESSGLPCVVDSFIGGGGQGEVYRACWAGESVALKWYFTHQATRDQREALETLVQAGSPNDRFLWPLEIASSRDSRSFGYVMPLRDRRYKSIVDLMMRRAEPGFRALTTAGIELSDSFLKLHARGLCYRDISFGNVFFDPESGEVLICDNDNVAVNGAARTGVLGTPRFMAPEIVRRDASPSIQTDLYSLAVLLFYLLVVHHPLEGKRESAIKCLDLPAMNRLYGERPLFIFDPSDDSNAPITEFHDNALEFWPLYPCGIRRLFTRSFTEGLREPQKRVRESEWRAAFASLRDQIFYCACGQESFYCAETYEESGRVEPCWSCGRVPALPPHVRIGSRLVMLNRDSRLFPHHIDVSRQYDFTAPVAAVVENPNRPGQWGLQNLSPHTWWITAPHAAARSIDPGRSTAIAGGARIDFGSAVGEILI